MRTVDCALDFQVGGTERGNRELGGVTISGGWMLYGVSAVPEKDPARDPNRWIPHSSPRLAGREIPQEPGLHRDHAGRGVVEVLANPLFSGFDLELDKGAPVYAASTGRRQTRGFR